MDLEGTELWKLGVSFGAHATTNKLRPLEWFLRDPTSASAWIAQQHSMPATWLTGITFTSPFKHLPTFSSKSLRYLPRSLGWKTHTWKLPPRWNRSCKLCIYSLMHLDMRLVKLSRHLLVTRRFVAVCRIVLWRLLCGSVILCFVS